MKVTETAVDAYALRNTLSGYEVDELSYYDLARYLHTIILSEEKYEELDPTTIADTI